MKKDAPACLYCHGKGWRWGRQRTGLPGRMAKHPCKCKAGKAFRARREAIEKLKDQ